MKNYIKSGVVNTYGIIGIEEIENEDFKKIHNGYLENVEYGCIRKIFYSKFKNGKNKIKDLYLRK